MWSLGEAALPSLAKTRKTIVGQNGLACNFGSVGFTQVLLDLALFGLLWKGFPPSPLFLSASRRFFQSTAKGHGG